MTKENQKNQLFIAVEEQIESQYNQLEKAKPEKEKEIISNLKFLFKMEDDFLKEYIGKREELESYSNHLGRIITNSNLSKEKKESINNRIRTYLEDYYFINPFLSDIPIRHYEELEILPPIIKNAVLQKEAAKENSYIISEQCEHDRIRRMLYHIDQELEKKHNKNIKKELKNYKYQILQVHKIFEKYLDIPITKEELTDSSRSKVFNHNKQLVDIIYHNYFFDMISTVINDLIIGSIYEKNDHDKAIHLLYLIELKNSLELLSKEDNIKIAYDFFRLNKNKENQTLKIAEKTIQEITETISEKIMEKGFQKEKKN